VAESAEAQESSHDGPTASGTTLFRQRALGRQTEVFASVSVLTPPSLWSATLAAGAIVLALMVAACVVEIPERIPAVGILMPEGGVIRLRSPAAASVRRLFVGRGTRVRAGQPVAELDRDIAASSIASLADFRGDSLSKQIELRAAAQRERSQLDALRLAANDRRIRLIERDTGRARQQQQLLSRLMGLARVRADRLAGLADRGLLARDQADAALGDALMARQRWLAGQLELDHLLDQSVAAREARRELIAEAQIDELEASATLLALDRERTQHAADSGPIVKAPADGYVLRLDVTPGDAVSPGTSLLSLASSPQATQAWLYVSTRDAALLEAGQVVTLRFDALPYEHYGVASARIVAVGQLAMGPGELPPTLRLAEPAFEVRAELEAASADAFVSAMLPGFGVSFRADVIRGRRRVIDWAMDRLRAGAGGGD
jgi:membrane fusion protein